MKHAHGKPRHTVWLDVQNPTWESGTAKIRKNTQKKCPHCVLDQDMVRGVVSLHFDHSRVCFTMLQPNQPPLALKGPMKFVT